MISILKKILFWISFIPCFLLVMTIRIPAFIFGLLSDRMFDILIKFENWSFEEKNTWLE